MRSIARSIFDFLNRDLSGKTWERRESHPYFGEMIYFGSKDSGNCYWEAEVVVPGQSKTAGITMRGTSAGPTQSEETFCRAALSDVDALFRNCVEVFEPEFIKWAKQPFPSDWRQAFILDGFDVPADGKSTEPWGLCYFVEPAGHYFTAQFVDGKVSNVLVDG